MKHIFHIYKENMKTIFTNYAALIVILALCILPSLYAWFNIKASWDPYGQQATSGIKIGVVNLDKGATVKDTEVNIGDTVIDNLKENQQLGWQFVDQKTAKNNIENGKYYAMITIPEDFSTSLTSILSSDVKKGTIIYTVNEKINAVAPKLTDKGVTTLQNMISQSIVQTVSKVIFELANQVGIDLEAEIPNIIKAQNLLTEIQGEFPSAEELVENTKKGIGQLKDLLNAVNENLPEVKEIIENSSELGANIKVFLSDSESFGEQIAPVMKRDLVAIQGVIDEVTTAAEGLKSAIEGGVENAPEILAQLKSKAVGLESMVKSLIPLLETFNGLSAEGKFTNTINQLKEVSEQLSSMITMLEQIEEKLNQGETVDLSSLDNFISSGKSISSIIGKIVSTFEKTIEPELTVIFQEANQVIDQITGVLKDAEEKLPDVAQLVEVASTSADKGEEGMEFIQEILPQAKALMDDLVDKLKLLNEDDGLEKLASLLKVDVESQSEFLANPVEIQEEKLFPMENYGTAMSPFYTVLALWVGILLLMSILSVEASGEYKAYEVYFGKFLLFGTITIVQALIVSLGDLYILKIYCKNPLLFILGNVLVSITFTAIVYSLVSVLGNIGKVIAIILLVLQVAGSGGTFPIQLTPVFFQKINPFLPFTYGISFAREAIGGVVKEVLWRDILIMLVYTAVFIVLSLLCKKTVNRWLHGFFKGFTDSKLGES